MKASISAFPGTIVLAFLTPAVYAQGLVATQSQVVATTGDVIPGSGGATIGGGSGILEPALQDNGRILFQTRVSPSSNDNALVYGDSLANLSIFARFGMSEPSGTIPGAVVAGIEPAYFLASDGSIYFSTRLSGAGVTFNNDAVLYAGTPGNFQAIAREGSQAADCPPGTLYVPGGGIFGTQGSTLNAAAGGRVVFQSGLSGALTSSQALFTGTPGALTRVMTVGEVVNGVTILGFGASQINISGQVLIDQVAYSGGVNNSAVWLYTPGGGKQEILRQGDPTPILGINFAPTITIGPSFRNSFNSSGQVLIASGLSSSIPGAVTFGVNDLAIFRISASQKTLMVRRGDPAPGIPGATIALNSSPTMHMCDGGTMAFNSVVIGSGISPSNDGALWIGTPGNWTLIAREGSLVPGTGGSTIQSLAGNEFLMNNSKQLAFFAAVGGGAVSGFALLGWDAALGVQPLILPNDSVEVKPGLFQPVTGSPKVLVSSNGASRSLSFADDGTLAALCSFGSLSSELKVRLGSLTGLPKQLSAAVGGTHKLHLNAGPSHAGEFYLVAGSVSGSTPGFPLGAFQVPLNFDAYTNLMLTSPNLLPFTNTFGVLNASGRATASIAIPAGLSVGAGLSVNHAFIALDALANITFVSEAATLQLFP